VTEENIEAGKRVLERIWTEAGFKLDQPKKVRWASQRGSVRTTWIYDSTSGAWEAQHVPARVLETLGEEDAKRARLMAAHVDLLELHKRKYQLVIIGGREAGDK